MIYIDLEKSQAPEGYEFESAILRLPKQWEIFLDDAGAATMASTDFTHVKYPILRKVEPKRWRADYACEYFYVDSYGGVYSNIERDVAGDHARYAVANYFECKSDAMKAAQGLKDYFLQFHEVKA